MIGPKDRPRFAAYAAPEAIEAERQRAYKHLDRAQRYAAWLDTLATQRAQQVAAGSWPPPPTDEQRLAQQRADAASHPATVAVKSRRMNCVGSAVTLDEIGPADFPLTSECTDCSQRVVRIAPELDWQHTSLLQGRPS